MERDDKQVAADLADVALGVWEQGRKVLVDSQPKRNEIADVVDGHANKLTKLAEELRASPEGGSRLEACEELRKP